MTTTLVRDLIIGHLLRQGVAQFNSARFVSKKLNSVVADNKVTFTESASLADEITTDNPNATFETQSALVLQKSVTYCVLADHLVAGDADQPATKNGNRRSTNKLCRQGRKAYGSYDKIAPIRIKNYTSVKVSFKHVDALIDIGAAISVVYSH